MSSNVEQLPPNAILYFDTQVLVWANWPRLGYEFGTLGIAAKATIDPPGHEVKTQFSCSGILRGHVNSPMTDDFGPIFEVEVTGRGIATLTLTAERGDETLLNFESLRYDFEEIDLAPRLME